MKALEQLNRHRDNLLALASRHRATRIRIFGSVARGEDKPDSDIDLLVDFAPEASLLDLVGLQQDAEALLGSGRRRHTRGRQPFPARADSGRRPPAVSRDPTVLLRHIRLCLDRIADYARDGQAGFMSDPKTQDAIIRNLEIIGQAVRDYGIEQLEATAPALPWQRIAGTH